MCKKWGLIPVSDRIEHMIKETGKANKLTEEITVNCTLLIYDTG